MKSLKHHKIYKVTDKSFIILPLTDIPIIITPDRTGFIAFDLNYEDHYLNNEILDNLIDKAEECKSFTSALQRGNSWSYIQSFLSPENEDSGRYENVIDVEDLVWNIRFHYKLGSEPEEGGLYGYEDRYYFCPPEKSGFVISCIQTDMMFKDIELLSGEVKERAIYQLELAMSTRYNGDPSRYRWLK